MHPIFRVTEFSFVGGHTLRVSFDDGTTREIDFSPVLYGEMFGPLRDIDVFRGVKVDPEAHTLVWPNGADFDPATLHDWPNCKEDLVNMARTWARAEAVETIGCKG